MYRLLESIYSPPLVQYLLERFSIQVANSNKKQCFFHNLLQNWVHSSIQLSNMISRSHKFSFYTRLIRSS